MWLTDDQQLLWRDYLRMTARLQAAMNRQLQADCAVSLADYDVLVELSERGPLRVFELGEVLAWEQSRLSHHLRRMRDKGLVERTESAVDRRGAVVEISDAGRAALKVAAPGHAELVHAVVFDGMSDEQLHAVGEWTSMVLDRL